jgi:ribosomal protein L2
MGIMYNLCHGKHKLHKTWQSRWFSRCLIVQSVVMNPIDHLHGRGEGRTKGGKPSVSPWESPAKVHLNQ